MLGLVYELGFFFFFFFWVFHLDLVWVFWVICLLVSYDYLGTKVLKYFFPLRVIIMPRRVEFAYFGWCVCDVIVVCNAESLELLLYNYFILNKILVL